MENDQGHNPNDTDCVCPDCLSKLNPDVYQTPDEELQIVIVVPEKRKTILPKKNSWTINQK